jgi:hypothetical protein
LKEIQRPILIVAIKTEGADPTACWALFEKGKGKKEIKMNSAQFIKPNYQLIKEN